MRKLLFISILILNLDLIANPIVIDAPVISEYFYNQGNWQIELCIKSDLYGWLEIQSFDQLYVITDAGQVLFQFYPQFSYDSVYIIDQSWLSSTLIINPLHDNINIIFNDYPYWKGISYAPAADTMCVTTPGADESVAVQYFGGGYTYYLMKQSPPSIGTDVFEVSSRSGISGFVYDQYQNPVEGVSVDYYPSLQGKFPLPLISIETDINGYYESDEIYPMGYYVELTMDDYVLETDLMYFEPDSSYYKEYILTNVSIPTIVPLDDIEIWVAPNPFSRKTRFHITVSEELTWDNARIVIHNLHGQRIDFIPLTKNPWAGQEISVMWNSYDLTDGLYIYSLVVDGQAVKSGKLISY